VNKIAKWRQTEHLRRAAGPKQSRNSSIPVLWRKPNWTWHFLTSGDRVHFKRTHRADGHMPCQQPGNSQASTAKRYFSLIHALLPHASHFHPKQMF